MTQKRKFEVFFTKKFKKQYLKSDLKIRTEFDNKLSTFIDDKFAPPLNNHELSGKFKGFRSINVTGDWRAIFFEDKENVKFVLFGTHSQLYK